MLNESRKLSDALISLRGTVNQLENRVSYQFSMQTPNGASSFIRFQDMQRLREEIRQLKIECFCCVKEVDQYGEHALGDANLKLDSKMIGEPLPPPVPPRPSPSHQVQVPPAFGPLYNRVPPPPAPYRIERTASTVVPQTPSTPQLNIQGPGYYLLGGQRVYQDHVPQASLPPFQGALHPGNNSNNNS